MKEKLDKLYFRKIRKSVLQIKLKHKPKSDIKYLHNSHLIKDLYLNIQRTRKAQ